MLGLNTYLFTFVVLFLDFCLLNFLKEKKTLPFSPKPGHPAPGSCNRGIIACLLRKLFNLGMNHTL